nr:MAG TPA: hypothetical protein [Caudoviricetes sp.]
MEIKLISDNKTINIENEIIDKKSGAHYINVTDKENLDSELNRLHNKGIFDKYKMSYVYVVSGKHITLVLHKAFEFIR